MNNTIKPPNSRHPIELADKPYFKSKNKSDTKKEENSSNTSDTISISNLARFRYTQSAAIERQTSMSKSQLQGLHEKSNQNIVKFSKIIVSGTFDKEDYLPKTKDPERLALGQKALDFAIARAQLPPTSAPNPFSGMARNDLSAIFYDETQSYTVAERKAAFTELSKQDNEYFSQLSLKLTNGGDNREFFKSLLDYFADLPPVEQSVYPDGHKTRMSSLYQEQLDLWGPLNLIKHPSKKDHEKFSGGLFEEGRSPQKMLEAVFEEALALIRRR